MDTLDFNEKTPFFRRIDWASFWTATALSFLVYFFTLGPSVGLEDSGELAVAGDHLGVPHPPGYPIWTIISYCFARVFSFVTFRGQPNPAWAISLVSAVFGALAAGCTAMLITRSASDMMEGEDRAEGCEAQNKGGWDGMIAYVGGVAGSLIFAFSPVMWSQSTIVEVYSLGAFFLMLVMLLTYRWMRRPTDKLLWITAFVFGLGLTNYQVLLLAALPLVVIVFFRNIALFRDFIIVMVPFGLAAMILKLGSLNQQTDLPKRVAIKTEVAIPNGALVTAGVVALGLALVVLVGSGLSRKLARPRRGRRGAKPESDMAQDLGAGMQADNSKVVAVASAALLGLGLFLLLLAGLMAKPGVVGTENPANAALMEPLKYLRFAWLLAGTLGLAAWGAAFGWERTGGGLSANSSGSMVRMARAALVGAAVLALVALGMAAALPAATLPAGIDPAGVPTLGIGHYHVMFVLGLIVMVGLAATSPRSLVFALPVAAIEITLYVMVQKGVLLGLTHPSTWWFCAPVFFNFALLIFAALALPNGVSVAMTIFASELGLSFYAYMPIVSDLRNPPMNWGYPRTWEGFKHAITRGQYEAIKPTNIFTQKFVHQVGDYFIDLRRQFTLLLAPFGFLPFAAWRWRSGVQRRVTPFRLALGCLAVTVLFVVLGKLPATGPVLGALRIDKLFIGGLLLLAVFGGVMCVVCQLWTVARRALNPERELRQDGASGEQQADEGKKDTAGLRFLTPLFDDISQQWLIGTAVNFLVMSVVLVMLANPKGDLQDTFIQKVKFISSHGLFALWIGYGLVLGLAELRGWLRLRAPAGDGGVREAAFRSGLRDPVGDDRVQEAAFRAGLRAPTEDGGVQNQGGGARRWLLAAACVMVFLTPLIPIEQNYFNDRLVFELSGAEQNGHDYGWQFGNYQLRGAEAIREELEEDEEPLPNPLYPPEMGQGAVFFGGTDPGRFVPTYMIYSADVRPDVFLITQNALADNTFMSVTRDLYGDELWIPTPKDSEDAFGEFVDDVRTGKRQANSDIVVENGRVQVVGALGVMEINGILCEKIFEHNKRWHDFFVEESYVIPWMYPYLTPHGLIMKINSERTPLTRANTDDDMDFWDWYVRRMTRDGRYRRDIVAQKSFSKLRSAIAGLYMSRGRTADAERAYNDARVLYPVSPEATFRYVQDILMRQRRYAEALEMIEYFCKQDPNNDRGPYVKGVIEEIRRDEARLAELMGKKALRAGSRAPAGDGGVQNQDGGAARRPGGGEQQADNSKVAAVDVAESLEIATLQMKLGAPGLAREAVAGLADAPGLSVAECLKVATILDQLGDAAGAARAMDRIWRKESVRKNADALRTALGIYENTGDLEKLEILFPLYLKTRPDDWQSWLALSSLNAAKGKMDAAAAAMEAAVQHGGDKVAPLIEKTPSLMQVYQHLVRMRREAARSRMPGGSAMPGAAPLGGGFR